MKPHRIAQMQQAIGDAGLDGWFFYGFHDVDLLGAKILELPSKPHFTRRWFCLIPAAGKPRKLVHRIEAGILNSVPGESRQYLAWRELQEGLGWLLQGQKRVATQYSENSAIPYVSRVDGGILDLLRKNRVEVVSSADLIQLFDAVWSPEQVRLHETAAEKLAEVLTETYAYLRNQIERVGRTDEFSTQAFMGERFKTKKLVSDSLPIVACNANSGNPHYFPTQGTSQPIRRGDFVLLDLWAKEDTREAVYADYTWTCFVGSPIPRRIAEIFSVVRRARDRGVELVAEAIQAGRQISGWQVDDAVRQVIHEAGYGGYFIHRTGHSLGTEVHGNGVNIDNLETQDRRRILPGIAFTIEPGIYLPHEFGIRSEINVLVEAGSIRVTGPQPQKEVLALLS